MPIGFALLVAAWLLLPLLSSPSLPLNPPGRIVGPPWWLGVGAGVWTGLAAVTALRLRRANRAERRPLLLLLAALGLYLVYCGNQALLSSDDNVPNRQLALRLLDAGTLDLTGVVPERAGALPYYILPVGDRLLPAFPLGTGLLSVPYVAVARALARGTVTEELLERWEKQLAAVLAVLAVFLFYRAVERRFGTSVALPTALAFGLATQVVTCVSQGLWSYTGETALVAAALGSVLAPQAGRRSLFLAGLALGGAFLCRPSALLVAVALALFVARDRRRGLAPLLAGALSGTAGAMLFLDFLYGHPLGGYGLLNLRRGSWSPGTAVEGILGNLASPSRGLLVYFPWLLLLPACVRRGDRETRTLSWTAAGLTAALVVLAGTYGKWWGGHSVGPRLLTEAAPFMALLLVPCFASWRRLGSVRIALAALLAFSAVTQLLTIYNPHATAWNSVAEVDLHPEVLWSLRNSQLAAAWVPGWRVALPPYPGPFRRAPGERQTVHVDLTPAANAYYDGDPFDPGTDSEGLSHYPRLDPEVLNGGGRLFRFAARGRPNAVSTCRRAGPVGLGLPSTVVVVRLHALLAAGCATGREGDAVAGTLAVRHLDGTRERFPLRLNREVFEYRTFLRRVWPPLGRLYAGSGSDPDALVETTFRLRHPARLARLELASPGDRDLGVALLALTLETRAPSAGGTSPPVSSDTPRHRSAGRATVSGT